MTLIPGDGVGPEVIGAAVKVIEAVGVKIDWDRQLAGAIALRRFGSPVPDQLIDSLKSTKVALKGPLETRVGEGYRSINVYLRKLFELYANVRPVRTQAGVHTPFSGVDIIVIRENTEDLYAGIEHQVAPGVVESVKIITARASTRIARFAFEYARTNHRHLVTAIHKANIMKLSDGLFLKCAQRVARDYREIEYQEQIVDAACMRLVTNPQAFDVLLLENLYGDIVSDLCAGLVGGLGFVPGANYGRHGAIFETVHGTAPDIAGKGIANPGGGDKDRRAAARLSRLRQRRRSDPRGGKRGAACGPGGDAGYRRQGDHRGNDRGGDPRAQVAADQFFAAPFSARSRLAMYFHHA